jgi:short-subunit dehydrogenase
LSDFRQIVELNVYRPLLAMQVVIPIMKEAGREIIVNISSMVSKMHIPGLGAYAATKAALNLLSETARFELESEKIKVITVFPRTTATDFGKNSIGGPGAQTAPEKPSLGLRTRGPARGGSSEDSASNHAGVCRTIHGSLRRPGRASLQREASFSSPSPL